MMIPAPDSAERFAEDAPCTVGNAGTPALRLGAWEGPLDLLLELARAQRVDLAQLSIATLAEQFTAAVDAAIARRQVPLSRLAEWHIMAALSMLSPDSSKVLAENSPLRLVATSRR